MPRTEDAGVPVTQLLAQLTTAATATPGKAAKRKLPSGLHVAALQRPAGLVLTVWRTASRQPSRKECEIVARDAGFQHPKYSLFDRPDGITAFVMTDAGGSAASPLAPVARPAGRPVRRVSTPVDSKEAQKVRDEAERQVHIRILSLCARVHGLRVAWFRRREALDARLGYLNGLTLDDLREERWSRYTRWQLQIALTFALLLLRWRSIFLALLPKATAKRTRKPRQAATA